MINLGLGFTAGVFIGFFIFCAFSIYRSDGGE